MRHLLSIKTVYPRPGGTVWYDDQREVHRQIFNSDEAISYAFMGRNPDAADNQWLRDAHAHRVPIIYFLGIAPGRYLTLFPAFIEGWNKTQLKGSGLRYLTFVAARRRRQLHAKTSRSAAFQR